MTISPRPLALGLLHFPEGTGTSERSRARVSLALRANNRGYALLETFGFGMSGLRDDLQFQEVEDLVARLDVQGLIVAGAIDVERVEKLAELWRLILIDAALQS
jgi:hypothetical protein